MLQQLRLRCHPQGFWGSSVSPPDKNKQAQIAEKRFLTLRILNCISNILVKQMSRICSSCYRFFQAIHSIAWHNEGKQFMCSHSDGSLTLWNLKGPSRPFQIIIPHGKTRQVILLRTADTH